MDSSLTLQLNGETRHVPAATDLRGLLDLEGLGERRVAVEINGEIVPRSRHAGHALHDGDRVEIVHALGGG
ncbi:sulfur carrier protein ThiS [Lysobacter sp. TY2-98]|uniref:sulfur carrier protein ThiS n=1 Tax=Lysobacter sp. TY2-98 TaxID=2290922 RepID=UPI000E1FC575|nr:sulfur carrier protein ThiS [Lysobacter sp. TY2-98]AXK71311.1 sulfur carrier protein ThiS [Lysobacter sp. TY2-98]